MLSIIFLIVMIELAAIIILTVAVFKLCRNVANHVKKLKKALYSLKEDFTQQISKNS